MNLPNKLTVFRIILIPIFIILACMPEVGGSVNILGTSIAITKIWSAVVFAVASLTDFLDGQIARRQHLVTNFGKFADPIADKMLTMSAFVILVEMNMAPSWVVAIIVCRELAISGLRLIIVENDGQVLAAEMPGKIKTFSQMFAIIFLLLNNIFANFLHFGIGTILLYVCLFFTVYSGVDYFVKNRAIFSDSF
ncbi:CDP-diacylglycerol--glycerol-3-phosphate 3-phosphatidyltransferase [Pediococcus claussenii]|uniref:CDP-diacylglycerol--glycerol-3-phosphate 3-phosphatidyltransferase n=1 Tax=Pediococcus claussenii (strain ATCC BAA-344 / DSM 14800 / JCM 18046 / KCTC 3811 / LMG 21948 / P06) TaxID=701521 RepID=G8PCL4_PEDCP|nr:CDP-diacylglycerol--glycerol-3-phosphate 3-phosphatidyltransferase [Pediococcus claussenii]AEV94999.1 CDP-diacylglycerol--glycerol-3-phosphate 3-phosphatidyltransferase [Pediococcus claussenii ATCC BAA-344]ANZ70188.1 CDP-diacylglycerol--glycerol-3-phosphate 3-phosphatidyltransferase [Pediococcus claussenii]ANZ72004.1 CDP-diacylglycerol--glycerol-3-phosphate 3-phosphatidyltransferase [Pediococcus claussenii]KRN19199.1 pgsA protein [Pediococcus claussenii]